MQPKSFLATCLVASVAALSFGAHAAADADKAPAADAPAVKAVTQKKMKPHSHMEEKTGIPAPEPQSDNQHPAKDKTRHNHQRDMK
ncbi:MAG: hypothetical protein HGA47_03965 [Zoogloea sp.]|nr:hypothetical protein [Zoogloea sp.]